MYIYHNPYIITRFINIIIYFFYFFIFKITILTTLIDSIFAHIIQNITTLVIVNIDVEYKI